MNSKSKCAMIEDSSGSSNHRAPYLLFLMVFVSALAPLTGCGDSGGTSGSGPAFIVCESTFANCTVAPCTLIADAPGFASCNCDVMTSYSAGLAPCQDVQDTGLGQVIYSRYHPITSYALCANARPWAMCLDSPCLIDPDNPSQAACICTLMENQGDYIFVDPSGQYSPSSCTTGLYSCATVVDVDQVTNYLKTHDTPLKALPIEVYDGQ